MFLDKETLEIYIKDESERIEKCDDEETKKLLQHRVISYERMLKEFENAPD